MSSVRAILFHPDRSVEELAQVPASLPKEGFLWVAYEREFVRQNIEVLQADLARLTATRLLELHTSDLLNTELPSHFDYTSEYDMLVIRRLADQGARQASSEVGMQAPGGDLRTSRTQQAAHGSLQVIEARKLETAPVGFVLFDRVLLSVHPSGCSVLDAYVKRLRMLSGADSASVAGALTRSTGVPASAARIPDSTAELMLRMVSLVIDGYLNLRKTLTRRLDHWQERLMRPELRINDWNGLLEARQALHHLYEICEDQRSAVMDWMDVLDDWPQPMTAAEKHQHDQLLVRTRDVLEHIERVAHHVRLLEQSAETAVQIHFNIQSNRTNDVMRALTALTAVFLPLNLIAGIFGMNFEFIPWLHSSGGFWGAIGVMIAIAIGLTLYFVRKRYLSSRSGN